MAQLEITDKDIATVEQLHDHLFHKAGVPHKLHEAYRQLIARMYESVQKERTTNIGSHVLIRNNK